MSQQAALHTEKLAIGYRTKGHELFLHRNINLDLLGGEITCLLGPNGSGKSTLIRTLAGFQKPLAGEVKLDKIELSRLSASELSQLVSVVLTEQVPVGKISVFDMVAYGRAPYTGFLGRLEKLDREIVEQSLKDTGIEELHNRSYTELSDGERQKVMIAKSLAQQTPVIFLDEPTAFLDFPSKVEILQLLRTAAWEHNKAILLSTHDLSLAIQFADKIWLMGKDKPISEGVPEDLILAGQFGEFFDRENTKFDIHTGNFNFDVPQRGQINVEGEGLFREWLIKALQRKGYRLTNDVDVKIKILVNNDRIMRVITSKSDSEVKTIAGILDFLNNEYSLTNKGS